jgi:DNA-binding transcriptional MerR regulator
MFTDPATFDISELAQAAKVTVRTIRYYVQQGLLPQPGSRGPGTRYDQGHLERLQLIKRLQREHLPLAEIRRRLEAMDEAAVRQAMIEPPPQPARPSAALSYLHDVLGDSDAFAEGTVARAQVHEPPPVSDFFAEADPVVRRRPDRTMWERVALSPDIEFHIRRPLTRDQNRKVDRIIDTARHLLEEES